MLRWHTLAAYFRRKYGTRVQKIPLDAGSACPNRDGTLSGTGCTFCNARGSGSGLGAHGLSLAAQWETWRRKYSATDPCRWYMAYLQSFSKYLRFACKLCSKACGACRSAGASPWARGRTA